MTGANWFRAVAIATTSVSAALTPTYGKYHWYIIVVAVAGGIALAAQSVLGGKSGA